MKNIENEFLIDIERINIQLYDHLYLLLPPSRWDFILMASIDIFDKVMYNADRFSEGQIEGALRHYKDDSVII